MKQAFFFNTGVKSYVNDYSAPGDIWVNNERHIVFYCEGVPAGATFHSASVYGDIREYDHLLVFPIVGGNLCSSFAYFNPPPKPKKKIDLVNQWFYFTKDGKKLYFETCINGNGVYSSENNTVLGGLYNEWGQRLETKRLDYAILKPVGYPELARVFEII